MHIIKTGKDRIVIAFPRLGFVLKVARFGLGSLIDSFKRMRKSSSPKRFSYFKITACFICKNFTKSVGENLRERKLWRMTKNVFLLPTRFSFFGIVNVMPYAKKVLTELEYNNSDLLAQISFFSGFGWQVDCHTFSNNNNFCVDEYGKVKMLDYGFKGSYEFIKQSGQKLYDNLEPSRVNTSLEFQEFKIKTGELRMQRILQMKAWMKEHGHIHDNC